MLKFASIPNRRQAVPKSDRFGSKDEIVEMTNDAVWSTTMATNHLPRRVAMNAGTPECLVVNNAAATPNISRIAFGATSKENNTCGSTVRMTSAAVTGSNQGIQARYPV